MKKRGFRRLRPLVLSCFVGLSACAIAPPAEKPLAEEPWASRQMRLAALQDWSLTGRIGVTQAAEGWHGSVHWEQQGPHYAIDLIGPLGQGRTRIEGGGQGVVVRTADGQSLRAADPQQLLEEAVGVRIPVEGLVYWVRGMPDPTRPSELTGDRQGRLTHLEQDGWMIDYSRYEPVAALELPTRIRARQGDLQVKLAIQDWNLAP